MSDKPKVREITAQQFVKGYFVLNGTITTHHEYRVVYKTDRGTYVVDEPDDAPAKASEEAG